MKRAEYTLAAPFSLEGIGIHTGQTSRAEVCPAEPGTGRRFQTEAGEVPALAEYVADTRRCTALACGAACVQTVEHLLSALYALGIDNALIKVSGGSELPILDGSALPWAEQIREAGRAEQSASSEVIRVETAFTIREGESCAEVSPSDRMDIEVTAEFGHWPEGRATVCWKQGAEEEREYLSKIAPARTFAFRAEVDMLIAAGLAKGGSLDNALIITPPDGFSTALKVEWEWAAHKLLDVVGDLALCGRRLEGRVRMVRPGHKINTRLAHALREQAGLM